MIRLGDEPLASYEDVSMTIIGIDDTDSRTEGMCTTYVAARIADYLEEAGHDVTERLLIRLNPAVKRKTRGNAALAIHTDCQPETAFEIATRVVHELSAPDSRTSPGVVVTGCSPNNVPERVVDFGRDAIRHIHELNDALELIEELEWLHAAAGEGDEEGHGRIGALAVIGAHAVFDDWTYEHLVYRHLERCGTERVVDESSVFAAAEAGYPVAWDTVDKVEQEAVCVPNAPGPILFGIRGDDPEVCRTVADDIDCEPIERSTTYRTNQGTDAHIRPGEVGELTENAGYAVEGIVVDPPETRRGGHVFFSIAHPDAVTQRNGEIESGGDTKAKRVDCVAFEPTKRFRNTVRALRAGDRVTAVGEHTQGTIKLEKLRVDRLVREEIVNPTCEACERKMSSAGRGQGYRCPDCNTTVDNKERRSIERELDIGWYEVPPCARRHIAKPLIRGGFEEPTHPER